MATSPALTWKFFPYERRNECEETGISLQKDLCGLLFYLAPLSNIQIRMQLSVVKFE